MASENGPPVHPLIEQLRDVPHAFDFFQAARRLECEFADRPRIGHAHRASDEAVRFGQQPDLAFAPASLAGVEMRGDVPPRVLVRFLGLLGPNGPMPLHLTEYIRARKLNYRDPTFAAFLDIFHHRAIALFYRAWASAQQAVSHQRPQDDRFAVYIASLIGRGMEPLCERDSVPEHVKLFYSGRFASPTRNAEGLQAVLAGYFEVPVRLEEFVGQWLPLDDDRLLRLGASPATGSLGQTAVVGRRVWDRQQKFRISMGPMDFDCYQRLLPGGRSLKQLVDLVRNYLGDEYLFDVRLTLAAGGVPGTRLGAVGQLGWSTWIASKPLEREASDLVLRPVAA